LKKILLIFFIIPVRLLAQGKEQFNDVRRDENGIRIVFYNVENLFDTIDDPTKNDNEFLPNSKKKWNSSKYWQKQKSIAKVLIAVGGWEAPDIIGLAEIENRQVLVNLTRSTALKNFHYEIIHKESPDIRGIDVALIYRPEKFKVIKYITFPVIYLGKQKSVTRDILYVKGLVKNRDTIHIFVNHWPSRMGGQQKSEPHRKCAASVLRSKVDSILHVNKFSNLIIMGDFNDEPDDISISEILKSKKENEKLSESDLVNLMSTIKEQNKGSLLFKDKTGVNWYAFDQIIVSKLLLNQKNKIHVSKDKAHVFSTDFLFKEKEDGSKTLRRTYIGQHYTAGFSDHLPVYVDFIVIPDKK